MQYDENGKEWPVLNNCAALRHNTLSAARGQRGKPKCLCPGAKEAYRSWRENRVDDPVQAALRRSLRPGMNSMREALASQPNLRGGSCTTPWGFRISDDAFSLEFTKYGFGLRQKAKDMCVKSCPLLAECKRWITKAEEADPGSFGGVYAGMDIWDRQGRPIKLVGVKVELISDVT
jgi:hypothetical protein